MSWAPDFEKKLVAAHQMKEPLPLCPAPCHGGILAESGGADGRETTLKCIRCGAAATYSTTVSA